MTRTEKRIIEHLKAGGWLYADRYGAESVQARVNYSGPAVFWTTRKTIRAMIRQGFLTGDWQLPEEPR